MMNGGGALYFKWHCYSGYLNHLWFSVKNFLCLLFFRVQAVLLSVFCNLCYFCLVSFLNFFLLTYDISISSSILWNSVSEMFPSWVACDIKSQILFNFAGVDSLIELCFSCFSENNCFDLLEAAFVRRSNILTPDKTTPMGKAHPLSNERMERLPVITTVAINQSEQHLKQQPKVPFLTNFSLPETLSEKTLASFNFVSQ